LSNNGPTLQSVYVTMHSANETRIELYKQTELFTFKSDAAKFPTLTIAFRSQPFFADIDGDLK
jgi:hypothetical protein